MPQKILLGTDSTCISSLIMSNPDYQVETISSYFAEFRPHCSERSFALLDMSTYEALSEQNRKRLENGDLLILLDDQDITRLLQDDSPKSVARYFYLNCESETSVANLWTVIDCIKELRTMSQRLNFYIKDSFTDIVDSNILKRQKLEIEELNRKLNEISRVDFLTSLLNRRALLESFEAERRRALRCRWRLKNQIEPLTDESRIDTQTEFDHRTSGSLEEHLGNFACMMLDIDHFKRINDSYGHLMGDTVLRTFGELLREPGLFRDTDVIGRYGGEEFIVLLPETNCAHAAIPAERLRERIRAVEFDDGKGGSFSITVSIGIAEFLPGEIDSDELIKRADAALYQAKAQGRDRVCTYLPEQNMIAD
ncbi:GGDEF domain-containing protein [Spirochaeta dissipatitropha]